MNKREGCEFFNRCGRTGHYFNQEAGGQVACRCLREERLRRRLGRLFSPDSYGNSKLTAEVGENLLLVARNYQETLRHLHPVALHIEERKGRWADLGLQRVMDIWLSKEDGIQTIEPILRGVDLLFFFVGYGEMINKERPGGILRVLDACLLDQIPVWVISKNPSMELSHLYDEESARRMQDFKQVVIK